jgi:hypothetical protein
VAHGYFHIFSWSPLVQVLTNPDLATKKSHQHRSINLNAMLHVLSWQVNRCSADYENPCFYETRSFSQQPDLAPCLDAVPFSQRPYKISFKNPIQLVFPNSKVLFSIPTIRLRFPVVLTTCSTHLIQSDLITLKIRYTTRKTIFWISSLRNFIILLLPSSFF